MSFEGMPSNAAYQIVEHGTDRAVRALIRGYGLPHPLLQIISNRGDLTISTRRLAAKEIRKERAARQKVNQFWDAYALNKGVRL